VYPTTDRFTDVDNQNLPMAVWFLFKPIFTTAPAASKTNTHYKNGKK